jgi:transposase-like protein
LREGAGPMGYRKLKSEFKRRVVAEWVSGGTRIAEVCRKHKLSDSVVRRWRKDYERNGHVGAAVRPNGMLAG